MESSYSSKSSNASTRAKIRIESTRGNGGAVADEVMTVPPVASFRLARYFTVASLAAVLLAMAPLLYFEQRENELFKRAQQEQSAFFAQMQESFVQRHDPAARDYLLSVYEAGNVNLTRLFANALWEKDFAPFVTKVQLVSFDRCRSIADIKGTSGEAAPANEKQACHKGIGKQFAALPEFRALDAKMLNLVKNSTVFKIKVFDLRGITVYSSEHNQIGEDKTGDAGWKSAMAGKPASQLTFRDKFSTFEGEVANRDLISSYVPVLAPDGKRIVAVFEVYSDVTQFLDRIKSTSSEIRDLSAASQAQIERAASANRAKAEANGMLQHAVIVGLLVLLYLALLLIMRYGQRIIDKQDLERKRVQEALQASEERHRTILQTAMDGFWLVNGQGRLLEVNETYCRMSGYSKQELLTMHITGLETKEAADETAVHMKEIVAKGEDRFESRHHRKDGSIFDVEVCVQYSLVDGGRFVVFIQDITERKRAEQELIRSQQELRRLSKAANEALEAERRRTAREMHDELGQSLTALKMDLESLRSALPSNEPDLGKRAQAMHVLLDSTIAATRRIAANLRPLMLDDLGLAAALDWLTQNFSKQTGIATDLVIDGTVARVPEPIASALYRITQESLNNVTKYAQATTAEIRLERDGDWVQLLVRDNGRGIKAEDQKKQASFGLLGIRERVMLLSGEVTIKGEAGRGSEVRARIPLGAAEPQ